MRTILQLLPALPLLLATACAQRDSAKSADAENAALAWHDSVMAAMGGRKAWERTRYLRFRWNVFRDGELVSDRLHHWDRYDGRYRVETTTPEGESFLALLNVNTQEGQAWLNGRPVEGARNDTLVRLAYAMFVNDSYWLLMPYKWRDPGVNVEYLGPQTDDDGAWHVLHLSFEGVGLTPGDQYWAYVSAEPPHLMRKWQYHLQDQESKGSFFRWENWQQFGAIKLATERNPIEGSTRIEFKDVTASDDVPPGVFDAPPEGGA